MKNGSYIINRSSSQKIQNFRLMFFKKDCFCIHLFSMWYNAYSPNLRTSVCTKAQGFHWLIMCNFIIPQWEPPTKIWNLVKVRVLSYTAFEPSAVTCKVFMYILCASRILRSSSCYCSCSVSQSCPTLWDSMDCSPPDSSVLGIFQARYWSGLPFLSLGDLPDPGIKPVSLVSPALAGGFFTTSASWEAPKQLYFNKNK